MKPSEVREVIEGIYKVDLSNKSRVRPFVDYVKLYFYFTERHCNHSLYEVGAEVNRNHATVIHGRKSIKGFIHIKNQKILQLVDEIGAVLGDYKPISERSINDDLRSELAREREVIQRLRNKIKMKDEYYRKNKCYWQKKYEALKQKNIEVEFEIIKSNV